MLRSGSRKIWQTQNCDKGEKYLHTAESVSFSKIEAFLNVNLVQNNSDKDNITLLKNIWKTIIEFLLRQRPEPVS